MVYDSNQKQVILFGGHSEGAVYSYTGFFNETWSFNASTGIWTQKTPIIAPGPRYMPAMAYDSSRGQVFVYGGVSPSHYSSSRHPSLYDMWVYDILGNSWTELYPTGSLGERFGCSMVYDSSRDQLILFGGGGGYWDNGTADYYERDTWIYDIGTNHWTQVNPTGPNYRLYYGMVYDSMGDQVLLFGGSVENALDYQDTWKYTISSNTWTQLYPTNHPPARGAHGMALDSKRRQVILFAGFSISTGSLEDTWSYDIASNSWTQKTIEGGSPSPRHNHNLVYDPTEDKMILFGGYNERSSCLGDTWVFSCATATWTDVTPLDWDLIWFFILLVAAIVGINVLWITIRLKRQRKSFERELEYIEISGLSLLQKRDKILAHIKFFHNNRSSLTRRYLQKYNRLLMNQEQRLPDQRNN